MIDFRPYKFVMTIAAFLAGITGARAQQDWLVFYPISGEVVFGFDGEWTKSNDTNTFRDIEYEERLRLQFGGYSLDPRIFNFSLFLEPVLTQEESGSGAGGERTNGTFVNYNGRFSALHGAPKSPISLAGNFSGTSDDVRGDFGTRRDVVTQNLGLDLHWKFSPFPSTFSYLERSLDETFTQPTFSPGVQPITIDRDEFQKTYRYRGRSSKMELFLEGIEFDGETVQFNPAVPQPVVTNTDYNSSDARLNNYWRWGKGSSFTSRLTYYTREGYNAYDKATVDENLRLQHLENLYTTYGYSYEMQDRTVRTQTHTGNFELNHTLYDNLTTSLKLEGSTTTADQFRDDDYSANLDFYYRKEFDPNLRVNANLGGGYRVSDRSGGQLDFSETRLVEITGIVILVQRFIIVSTIIVTAPGCNPCIEGTDYLVEDAGGDLTQLRIPAGSRINIGDTITIDYTFEPPTAKFYGIPYRVGIRVDNGWAAFYHRTSGESQHFISGPDPNAVGDQRTDTTGVELRYNEESTRLFASAERRYNLSINFESTEYTLREGAYHRFAPNLSMGATLSQSLIYDTNNTEAYHADFTMNWYPVRGLWVNPVASAFYRATDPSTEERFWKVGVNTRWNWRRLGFDLQYEHTDDMTDGNNRIDDRLMMNLRRRF